MISTPSATLACEAVKARRSCVVAVEPKLACPGVDGVDVTETKLPFRKFSLDDDEEDG
jgi:hypothetical protein